MKIRLFAIENLFLLSLVLQGSSSVSQEPPLLSTTLRGLLRLWGHQVRDALGRLGGATDHGEDAGQPILVSNAGHGRTGTASFVKAMERLGLRCYHMKEGVIETPGHLELWSRLLIEKSASIDDVLKEISKEGFNATADVPISFFYKEQMQRYPDAPVVLSIRSEERGAGEAWARSMWESVMRFPAVMSDIPFRWIPNTHRLRQFLDSFQELLMPGFANESMGIFQPERFGRFYDEWVEDVKHNVPAEKLLVFKASDGWKPLCDHISAVSPNVAATCKEVLDSGEPYPYVNVRASVQKTQFIMRCISVLTYIGLIVPSLLVIFRVLQMLRRRNTSKSKVHEVV